jgi:hypothetical protein
MLILLLKVFPLLGVRDMKVTQKNEGSVAFVEETEALTTSRQQD